jgi:hypothetical protein
MSEKSVAQKLHIRNNFTVLLINEPKGYRDILGELPQDITVLIEPKGQADLIQVFLISREELAAQLARLKPAVKPNGLLWVTYPKGTSEIKADINRDIIWKYADSIGLKAVAMVSIDQTWSAMRLKAI